MSFQNNLELKNNLTLKNETISNEDIKLLLQQQQYLQKQINNNQQLILQQQSILNNSLRNSANIQNIQQNYPQQNFVQPNFTPQYVMPNFIQQQQNTLKCNIKICYNSSSEKCKICKRLFFIVHLEEKVKYHYGTALSSVSSDSNGHISSQNSTFVSSIEKNKLCVDCKAYSDIYDNVLLIPNNYRCTYGCCILLFCCGGCCYLNCVLNKEVINKQLEYFNNAMDNWQPQADIILYNNPLSLVKEKKGCCNCDNYDWLDDSSRGFGVQPKLMIKNNKKMKK